MRTGRRKTGMRFIKRLGAVILAVSMLLSSAQLPGGTAFAADDQSALTFTEVDAAVAEAADDGN